jgi:hypothetical protein
MNLKLTKPLNHFHGYSFLGKTESFGFCIHSDESLSSFYLKGIDKEKGIWTSCMVGDLSRPFLKFIEVLSQGTQRSSSAYFDAGRIVSIRLTWLY